MKNILAVISGIVIGSMVNMSLVMVSGEVIPPPAGVDVTNMESLAANMHLFESRHFVFPFLAHALGTFFGALVAAMIASGRKMGFALGIGAIFLLGGISNLFMLPSPAWFMGLDLVCAYIPMAWLGGMLAIKMVKTKPLATG